LFTQPGFGRAFFRLGDGGLQQAGERTEMQFSIAK
jgi:hypothetical protein